MTNGEAIREKLKGTILEDMTDLDIAECYGRKSRDCENCQIYTFCKTTDSVLTCPMVVFVWLRKEKVGDKK